MITLSQIAIDAMLSKGFLTELSNESLQELDKIHWPAEPLEITRDKRELMWVSIDNDDSEDLDQLTYAEEGIIYIAVADVDAIVKLRSAIDIQASHNSTSVYTPTRMFPMLPLKLSTNLTSLNEHQDRCAIVVEMNVAENGNFELREIYPALVNNKAKLTYNNVGAFLEKGTTLLKSISGLEAQLRLQDKYAKVIKEFRDNRGALTFGKIELDLIIEKERPVALEEKVVNSAHHLIENFMIAANVGVTKFLIKEKVPVLRRVVRTPKNWERIVDLARQHGSSLPGEPDVKALRDFLLQQQTAHPEQFVDLSLAVIKLVGRGEYVLGAVGEESPGHFDLALTDYSHTTAPNRRYPDVIMQRLLKSQLFGQPVPYTESELNFLAKHCSQKEDDATRVERRMQKSAAAMYLEPYLGKQFKAMVTGASSKGTWVRLHNPPIEGKVVKGFQGLEVGDYVTVKLVNTDIINGFIDFVKV